MLKFGQNIFVSLYAKKNSLKDSFDSINLICRFDLLTVKTGSAVLNFLTNVSV